MPKKLVVAEHGDDSGYPFHVLFDEVAQVKVTDGQSEVINTISNADCLLLWGGTDICPMLYGQKPNKFNEAGSVPSKRDLFEWKLIKMAVAAQIPIIGVCRGAQLLCAFDGGELAQDIEGHLYSHNIKTYDGQVMMAKANHHQMMLPKSHNVLLATTLEQEHGGYYIGENDAISTIPKGYLEPEVVHFTQLNAIGFQPHPEWMDAESPFVIWCVKQVREKLLEKETV